MAFGIFQQIQGWLKIRGSDGTMIGNDGDSLNAKVTASALPTGASSAALQAAGNGTLATILANGATGLKQDQQKAVLDALVVLTGAVNETQPADELTASGLNGRLKRVAYLLQELVDGVVVVPAATLTTHKDLTNISLLGPATELMLHNVTGSGFLYGATFVGSSSTIRYVIEIDGSPVFDFTGDELTEVVNVSDDWAAATLFSTTNDGKRVYFRPPSAFRYESSLAFKAYGPTNRNVTAQVYTYSEDV